MTKSCPIIPTLCASSASPRLCGELLFKTTQPQRRRDAEVAQRRVSQLKQLNWKLLCVVLVGLLAICSAPAVVGQTPSPTPAAATPAGSADEKSTQIINHAIEVVGGPAYLNLKTVVGRGFFTSFQDGISQIPARFLDY